MSTLYLQWQWNVVGQFHLLTAEYLPVVGHWPPYFICSSRSFTRSFCSTASKYDFCTLSCCRSGKKSLSIIFSILWKITEAFLWTAMFAIKPELSTTVVKKTKHHTLCNPSHLARKQICWIRMPLKVNLWVSAKVCTWNSCLLHSKAQRIWTKSTSITLITEELHLPTHRFHYKPSNRKTLPLFWFSTLFTYLLFL